MSPILFFIMFFTCTGVGKIFLQIIPAAVAFIDILIAAWEGLKLISDAWEFRHGEMLVSSSFVQNEAESQSILLCDPPYCPYIFISIGSPFITYYPANLFVCTASLWLQTYIYCSFMPWKRNNKNNDVTHSVYKGHHCRRTWLTFRHTCHITVRCSSNWDSSAYNKIGSWQNVAVSASQQFLFQPCKGHCLSTNTIVWYVRNLLCTPLVGIVLELEL